MGRFSVSVKKTDMRCGAVAAASLVSPVLQGVSAGKRRSIAAFSSLSISSRSTVLPLSGLAFGNDVSRFVTIGDYDISEGEMPLRGLAEMRLKASPSVRAGKWADAVDAKGMKALSGEQKAGCDAGKRVLEPTAGSLAEGTLSAGRTGGMFEMARMGGNERNRVKC
jgi:hypothetical protein